MYVDIQILRATTLFQIKDSIKQRIISGVIVSTPPRDIVLLFSEAWQADILTR